jgi:hypothetical protein
MKEPDVKIDQLAHDVMERRLKYTKNCGQDTLNRYTKRHCASSSRYGTPHIFASTL